MKRPVKIMLILLGAAALMTLVVVANINRSRSIVRGIDVVIRYGGTPHLVESQTVRDSIVAALPGVMSQQVSDVDREAVAMAASRVPYLERVNASVSVSGKIVVRARQRRPIARLFYGSREYYFDKEGAIMPTSSLGDCNVVVAGGDFREPLRKDSLNAKMQALVKLASFLDNEKQYGQLIDQIYIEDDGDIMMVPKLGDQVIELGDAEDLESKFSNLVTFYRKGMPRAGWSTYSRISLKYKGQVVCKKK